MIIYHGSIVTVETPRIIKSERLLDFGEGFYATANKEQAERWAEIVAARRKANTCVITEYEFNFDAAKEALSIVTFDKPDDAWLEFVCQNRSGRIPPPYRKRAKILSLYPACGEGRIRWSGINLKPFSRL